MRAARKTRPPITPPAMAPAGELCVKRDAAEADANDPLVLSGERAEAATGMAVELPWEEVPVRTFVYTRELAVQITLVPVPMPVPVLVPVSVPVSVPVPMLVSGERVFVGLGWDWGFGTGEEGSAGLVMDEVTVSGGRVGPGSVTCTVVSTTWVATDVETCPGIVETTVIWLVKKMVL